MWSVLAMYVPRLENALQPAFIQLIMIAATATALYLFLRPKCGRVATIGALLLGEVVSLVPLALEMLDGLGEYGDHYRRWGANYSDSVLIVADYFELFKFGINSFVCLIASSGILLLGSSMSRLLFKAGKP